MKVRDAKKIDFLGYKIQKITNTEMSTAETNNWRRKKLEELEEMENFAFCHDDSWGNEYAMPNINWEQHREAIEKIKKELADGPPCFA